MNALRDSGGRLFLVAFFADQLTEQLSQKTRSQPFLFSSSFVASIIIKKQWVNNTT